MLFESDPSGAKVFVNGFEKGTTPAQIKVKADDRVDFRLDNYRERVDTKYVKVTLEESDKTSFINFIENGNINKINVDEENKIIETIIVLNN